MAINFIENFSELPTDKTLQGLAVVPFGSLVGSYTAYTTATTMTGKTDGLSAEVYNGKQWLTRFNSGVAYSGLSMSNIRDQIPVSATGKFTIGYRWYAKQGYSAAWTITACRMNAAAQAPGFTVPAGVNTGYTELVFDRTAGTLEVFNEGASQGVVTISTSSLAAIRAGTELLQFPCGHATLVAITDFYITVDTGDDSQNGRLGAIDVNVVDLAISGTADGWDTTSLADVLARGDWETTDSGTRLVGQGVDKTLTLAPKSGYALPNKTAVLAMQAQVKGNYKAGNPGNLQIQLGRNTNVSSVTPVAPNALPNQANANLMYQAKSTDEQAWNTALTGLTLKLTTKTR